MVLNDQRRAAAAGSLNRAATPADRDESQRLQLSNNSKQPDRVLLPLILIVQGHAIKAAGPGPGCILQLNQAPESRNLSAYRYQK
jgi:hypothetical protein